MSFVKQTAITILVLIFGLAAWVYFSPGSIQALARYNLDIFPFKQIAALSPAAGAGQKDAAGNGGQKNAGRGDRQREVLVVTAPVTTGIINDRLVAIGNGRAAQSIAIAPLVSGQIIELPAASGDKVEKGAVIARLDSASEELALDKAKLVAGDQRIKTARLESLLARGSITVVEVETARAALSTAELAVRESELNLSRRTITSPIGGIVGILSASIGDYVTNQSGIVTIDDRSHIIIEYFVPERFATAFGIGATVEAYSVARPGEPFIGKVIAIDNRIDVASRTLKIRADIDNNIDRLRAGMAFEVVMRFAGEVFPAVDPLAIQWDSKGSYVWQIGEEGKAKRIDARIVQRNAESVLVEAALQKGDKVVTEGVQNVRAGAAVKVAGEKPGNDGGVAPKTTGLGS